MTQMCESCGQALPHDDAATDGVSDGLDGGVWLGSPGSSESANPFSKRARRGASAHGGRAPRGRVSGSSEKRLFLGLLAVMLAWGAFIGIGRLTSPDASIDEQAAAVIEERAARDAEAAAQAEEELADALTESDGDYTAADAAPGSPGDGDFNDYGGLGRSQRDDFIDGLDLDARTGITVQVERLKRQLERRDSNAFVAYRSANGVVLIDLVQGLAQVIKVDFESLTPQLGAHVLRSGPITFGIDPDTLDVAKIGDDSNLVVTSSRDDATYVVAANELLGQSATVDVVSNGVTRSISPPIGGLQLLPIDGLGILAVPNGATGETLIAGTDEFEVLSPNRVLTGTANTVLEQVCVPAGPCTLELLDLLADERTAIPASFIRFGDVYTVSPDGGALLRRSPQGFAEMFVVDGNAIAWVVGAGMQHAAWGPNSDFVVWLDEIGSPKLKIMFADERDWLSIDLRDLGAPPPITPELTVFAFEPVAGADQPDF